MALTALKILMCLAEKLRREEPGLVPKECRICLGGDDEREEWVDPCHCPQSIAWTHRNCLEWRLKYTRIEEDKVRCAVCRFPYVKIIQLKSPCEWFNAWAGPQLYLPACDLTLAYSLCLYVRWLSVMKEAWTLPELRPVVVFVTVLAHFNVIGGTYNVVMARRLRLPSFYKNFFSMLVVTVGDARPSFPF